MSAQSLIRSSLESISHQHDTSFFNDVVEAVKKIREFGDQLEDSDKRTEALNASNLEWIINQYTGLMVDITLNEDVGFNAAVLPPMVDGNNVLFDKMRSDIVNQDEPEDLRKLRKLKTQLIGGIDLDKGHVFGIYTQITSPLILGLKFLTALKKNDWYFEDQEVAAIILHEIGHLMTFYEYMGRTVLLTHVLGAASHQFTNTASTKKKIEIAKVTSELLDIDSLEPEAFGDIDNDYTFQSIVIAEYTTKKHSASDTPFYDVITSEALADQYVSRLGGARALTTALDKLHRATGQTARNRLVREMHVIANSIVWFYIAIASVFLPQVLMLGAMMLIGLTINNLTPDEYDTPIDRMNRLRNDMVDRLKDPNTSKQDRKFIKQQLEKMDEVIDQVVEFRAPLQVFTRFVVPSVRRQMRYKKMIQQLEQLANNELYVKSNALQTLDT